MLYNLEKRWRRRRRRIFSSSNIEMQVTYSSAEETMKCSSSSLLRSHHKLPNNRKLCIPKHKGGKGLMRALNSRVRACYGWWWHIQPVINDVLLCVLFKPRSLFSKFDKTSYHISHCALLLLMRLAKSKWRSESKLFKSTFRIQKSSAWVGYISRDGQWWKFGAAAAAAPAARTHLVMGTLASSANRWPNWIGASVGTRSKGWNKIIKWWSQDQRRILCKHVPNTFVSSLLDIRYLIS